MLSTNRITILIDFRGTTEKFICQLHLDADIKDTTKCIKSFGKQGINSIKEFQAHSGKFVTISKTRLTMWVNYYTELYIELQKTGYLK